MATGPTPAPAKRIGQAKITRLAVGTQTTTATTAVKIADPTGGATIDSQARTAIGAIIDVLEAFGLSALS